MSSTFPRRKSDSIGSSGSSGTVDGKDGTSSGVAMGGVGGAAAGGGGGGGGGGAETGQREMLMQAFSSLSLHDKCALSLGLKKSASMDGRAPPVVHDPVGGGQYGYGGYGGYGGMLGGAGAAHHGLPFDRASLASESDAEVGSIISEHDEFNLERAMSVMSPEELNELENEATIIQSNIKAWLMRRNYSNLRGSVERLQKNFRLHRKESWAASRLQAATRGASTRRHYQQLRTMAAAALVIQRKTKAWMHGRAPGAGGVDGGGAPGAAGIPGVSGVPGVPGVPGIPGAGGGPGGGRPTRGPNGPSSGSLSPRRRVVPMDFAPNSGGGAGGGGVAGGAGGGMVGGPGGIQSVVPMQQQQQQQQHKQSLSPLARGGGDLDGGAWPGHVTAADADLMVESLLDGDSPLPVSARQSQSHRRSPTLLTKLHFHSEPSSCRGPGSGCRASLRWC